MARSRRLIWTAPALDDLDEVASWIAADNPQAAAALVRRALAAVERLRLYPKSGRCLPELPRSAYREVIAPPCRIIYRRDGAAVVVVHVLRSERLLRPGRLR